jgi:acetyltransferase
MSTTDIEGYPSQYESWFQLKNGKVVFLRPILPSDEHLLVDLFNKMSPLSRYLRFLSQLQELPAELHYHLTHIDYDNEFALVSVVEEDGNDAIIAVSRYALDKDENIADLAVAVRDDWQHFGLGKSLLSKIITVGKEHGISRFGSMMDFQNNIVKKMLQELGYEVKYYFRGGVYQVEIIVEH